MRESQRRKILVLLRKCRKSRDNHRERADEQVQPLLEEDQICVAINGVISAYTGRKEGRETTHSVT